MRGTIASVVHGRSGRTGILLAIGAIVGTVSFSAHAGEDDQRPLAMPTGVLANSHEDGAAVELDGGGTPWFVAVEQEGNAIGFPQRPSAGPHKRRCEKRVLGWRWCASMTVGF